MNITKTKKIVFSLIAIFIFIVLAESISYIIIGKYSNTSGNPYHPYLGWKVLGNSTLRSGTHCQNMETATTGMINADSDGNSITPLEYAEPDVQIVITGGSTMFGIGSTDNSTTVSSWLERIIVDKLGIKAEVHNLGVSGYQSFTEMLTLHRFFKYKKADFVLAISGRNDSQYAFDEQDVRSASLINSVWEKAWFINQLEGRDNPFRVGFSLFVSYLRAYSYSAQLIDKALHFVRLRYSTKNQHEALKGKVIEDVEHYRGNLFDNIPQRATITSSNYAIMNTIASENNAKFMMVLQPTTFTKKHLTNAERICSESRVHGPSRMSNNLLKRYEEEFYIFFRSLKKSYTFYDHSKIMDNEKEAAYIDMAHYNDLGALRVAEAAYSILEPQLKKFKR
ncbi:MAG: SGNH/GDSL hydrolase family protein [Magnetococcales bacterium]|nr:SGNH/GDSL hydrolase family protein [Magnetococcales bacterium]